MSVTWGAPSDTGGLPITAYELSILDNSGSLVGAAISLGNTTLSYTPTLTKEQNYSFSVRADNAHSPTLWGPPATVGPVLLESFPDAPTLTNAQVLSQTQIELMVKVVTTGGRPIVNYTVQYRETGTSGAWVSQNANYNATFSLLAQPIVIAGLTSGKQYDFKVAASNALGKSPDSVVLSPSSTLLRLPRS